MTTNPSSCCAECFDTIARKSTTAARLWMDLCEIQVETPSPFWLIMETERHLRMLEIMGYVVTTDTPLVTYIKVNGRVYDEDGVCFCTQGSHGE